jgi:hypothetical protein
VGGGQAVVITTPDLTQLDAAVVRALETGDESELHVLGYGEISSVLAWPDANGPYACKRLPSFADATQLDAYRALFDEYTAALRTTGVVVHESHLATVPHDDGRVVAYCVQPVLDPDSLGPALLARADVQHRRTLLERIVDHIASTIRPALGLDAQLSNWAQRDGELVYLDVTTPLVRDADGNERLDTELFMASLPAAFRPFVRRFLMGGILDPYYSPRRAALDLTGNLHKEGLAAHVPEMVAIANERLGIDLTEDEVTRFYRREARMWTALQRARRVDRAWQRHVRRRPYQFLLPGAIDRGLPPRPSAPRQDGARQDGAGQAARENAGSHD